MLDFYRPSDIRMWPEHVTWAIEHLRELEAGRWPNDPRETGYTGGPGATASHTAYFVTPICLSAELNYRLELCNVHSQDGTLTIKCLADGWDEQTLADLMHIDPYRIRSRVERTVLFCSGQRRRRIAYAEFNRRYGIRAHYQKVRRV